MSCVHRVLPRSVTLDTDVACDAVVHDRAMDFQVTPAGNGARPLLFYITGDGGWNNLEVDVFRQVTDWGYPVIAVSAPEYLDGFDRDDRQTTTAQVAEDFSQLIASGRECLGGAGQPVILLGVSRGADLVVAAAGEPTLRDQVQGVVAISLTAEEEYVRPTASSERSDMLTLYDYLPNLEPLPVSVIQSDGDSYVPSEEARREMGSDTVHRRLFAIDARDHIFSDGRFDMLAALGESLRWIASISGSR